MALTVTNSAGTGAGVGALRPLRSQGSRDLAVWVGTVAFDSSYPTGGEAFNAESESGFRDVEQVWIHPKAGYTFEYVDSATAANRKIIVYQGDNDNAGDAPGVEVANETDLDAVTGVQVLVVGYR